MIEDLFCKSSGDVLDYAVDFRRELALGDSIVRASADVHAVEPGLVVTRVTYTDTNVVVWLAGGANGAKYVVSVVAETSQGRRYVKSFLVQTRGAAYAIEEIAIGDTSVTIGYLNDYTPSVGLRTSGAKIVRDSGEVVRLKSISWFGFESTNRVPHGLWAIGYKQAIDQIASLGFNSIRIPFAGDTFTGTPTGVDFVKPGNRVFESTTPGRVKPALDCLDIIIDYAAEKGLWIILDHHRRAVGTGADGNPTSATYTEEQFIATWMMLADRYKNEPAVIGADVYNEPHLLTWNAWADLAERCADQIHTVAPKWLIFVEGVGKYNGVSYWQGGQLRGVHDRPIQLTVQNRLVYSPHEYGQSVAAQTWLKASANPNVENWPENLPAVWRDAWGFIAEQGIAPVWVGEFGGKFGYNGTGIDNQLNGGFEREWGSRLVQYLNQHGISFAYWSFNPNSADTGGLVQDDWKTLQAGKVSLISPLFGQSV